MEMRWDVGAGKRDAMSVPFHLPSRDSGKRSLPRRPAVVRFSDLQVDSRMGLKGRMTADDSGTAFLMVSGGNTSALLRSSQSNRSSRRHPTYLVVSALSENPP